MIEGLQIAGMLVCGFWGFLEVEDWFRRPPPMCCDCGARIPGERPHDVCGCNKHGVKLEDGRFRCVPCHDRWWQEQPKMVERWDWAVYKERDQRLLSRHIMM